MTSADRNALEAARRSLGDCVLFRDLETADKDALLARACIRRVTAGETIFPMGSPGDSMMAVLSGNVRISVTSAEGREIALAILSEHDVFGEICHETITVAEDEEAAEITERIAARATALQCPPPVPPGYSTRIGE